MKKLLTLASKSKGIGMKYPVLSEGNSLQVDTPDSMGFEINQALQNLKIAVGGDVDAYVSDRLGYSSKKALFKALSAEQIDAVALAIYNIEEKSQGIIIADQTGIGKGRIAAAMIRYANKLGVRPIFITEKPNLFSDIYRDLEAIGSSHLVPFIVNARDSKCVIKDQDGNVLYMPPLKLEQDGVIESKIIPDVYDLVMMTYSQISEGRNSVKSQFLIQKSIGNILILDEAHNASGLSNTGQVLMEACGLSKGVTFLSATFAKRPDNMPLYASKTCISEANIDSDSIVLAFQKGGVALQEVVASQLASQGQLIRRERLYEGIEVNYLTVAATEKRDRALADEFTSILRDIILFQEEYVKDQVAVLDKEQAKSQSQVNITRGTQKAGVDTTPAFSKVFMLVNQMLFSLKADAVADRAILRLKQGKKPVIAFASTMGSFIEELHEGIQDEDTIIRADFSIVLQKALHQVLSYTVREPNGDSQRKKFDVYSFSDDAIVAYEAILAKIDKSAQSLCISPIDYIKQKIERAGYSVAEVTGRKSELILLNETGGLGDKQPRSKQLVGMIASRKKENVNDAFRRFNDNEVDVLMINQSGSTGASAHAIPTKKVPESQVKQRVMIVLQAELDINTEVQKRGRINRTGQILKPIYDYVTSSVPAEKRLMMMLQKKLKSLDANTTANQKNSEALMKSDDFLNKYGDRVVYEYILENKELAEMLDDPLKTLASNEDHIIVGAASKVSGRVAVLDCQEQESFYADIIDRYQNYIKELIEDDKYDLEVETQDLKAKVLESTPIQVGLVGRSPFSDSTFLEMCEVDVLRKPLTVSELDIEIKAALGGNNAEQISNDLLENADKHYKSLMVSVKDKTNLKYAEKAKQVRYEKPYLLLADDASKDEYEKKRLQEITNELAEKAKEKILKLKNEYSYVANMFSFFKTSMMLNYPEASADGVVNVLATFLGFRIDKNKPNPYSPSNVGMRIAVASSRRIITFSSLSGEKAQKIFAIKGASNEMRKGYSFVSDLLPKWEKEVFRNTKTRGIRHIITGNVLQAFKNDYAVGKLVQYTTSDNKVKKGVLLPESYTLKRQQKKTDDKVSVPIDRCIKVIRSLTGSQMLETDRSLSIARNRFGSYNIIVSASKQTSGDIYLDESLLYYVDKQRFEKVSNTMNGIVTGDTNIEAFVGILSSKHKVNALLTPLQFQLIADTVSTENKYSNEVKELPKVVFEQKENKSSKQRSGGLSLKYKYRSLLQKQELERIRLQMQ